MTPEALLRHFNGVRRTGANQWQALCPSHDDHEPSLSIKLVCKKILLHCHAGCRTEEILRAVGLGMSALYLDDEQRRLPLPQRSKEEDAAERTEMEILDGARSHHDYTSQDGSLLFRVVRYDTPGGKRYAVFTPRIGDLWAPGMNGSKPVLYNLPQIAARPNEPVFVVEGERCADALEQEGFVTTCNPFGAGKWRAEHSELLRGRHVVVLPDNDAPGREHAAMVRDSLSGVALSVLIHELEGLPVKGDVVDWLDAGNDPARLRALAVRDSMHTTWADMDREISPIQWDWTGWLPRGMVVILAGACDSGKSMLALRIAASFVRGDMWPDGSPFIGPTGDLVWCETEAAHASNLARAKAWGLPLDRIRTPFPDALDDIQLDSVEGMEALRGQAEDPNVRLIVIDSLSAAHGGDENSAQMRLLLRELAEIARDTGTPILIIHHFRKRGDNYAHGELTIDMLRGSSAIAQIPRVIWAVDSPDPARPDHHRLSVIKCNISVRPPAIGFDLPNGRIRFTKAPGLPQTATARGDATDLLRELLKDGPMPATVVCKAAKEHGISKATLDRAKQSLGINSRKGSDSRWRWHLPHGEEDLDDVEYVEEVDELDALP